MITRKQRIRKTTLKQYLSVFEVVTKLLVLPTLIKSLVQLNGSVYTAQLPLEFLKL